MASLITSLPAIAFPHELDTLRIHGNAPTKISIEYGGTPFQTTLTPNADQEIVVAQLADYFREVITAPTRVQILLDDSVVAETQVLPCRWTMERPAVEYCQNFFLSAAPLEKTTHHKATEVVHWWSAATEAVTLTARWMTESGMRRIEEQGIDISEAPNCHKVDVSPSVLTPPAATAQLMDYSLCVGDRRMIFRLPPKGSFLREPVSLTFENIFSRFETFHCFGTLHRMPKPNFHRARIGGRWRTLRVEEDEIFQVKTGALSRHEAQRISDLIATRRAWWNGKEIVIDDVDFEEDLSPLELQRATLTFRKSNVTPDLEELSVHVYRQPANGTFDGTFDPTFE